MASNTLDIKQETTAKKAGSKLFDFRWTIIGTLLVFAFAMFARWYQGWAAWEFGIDSTHPDFATYWMQFMYIELAVFSFLFLAGIGTLWMTRDKDLPNLGARDEISRYMRLVGMLFVYAFAFVWAGSFFAEQDAAWHQVVVRDTSFTPSHIIEFYGMFPMFICLGFASYTYAITRLPLFAKGVSWPLLIAVIGPMMVLPNVGYNEWGHAFWLMEEYFTVPLHYGFVVFGWSILALGGILVQIMSRISVLMPEAFNLKAKSA
jgi:methane/ammonia monooxygenase subunit C